MRNNASLLNHLLSEVMEGSYRSLLRFRLCLDTVLEAISQRLCV